MQVQFSETSYTTHTNAVDISVNTGSREGAEDVIRFGRFVAVPHSRQLFMDGRPREIGGRAFDLLMVLLKSNGGIVSKDEILNEVWPSMVVEECNLRFQIGSLRRALDDRGHMVKTIVRRGYMLVREEAASATDPAPIIVGKSSAQLQTNGFAKKPSIVLIEDDESVRRAIAGLLRAEGMTVAPFASVREYRESELSDQPACIILDICLPDRSGLDFQADLVKTGLWYPIIFISGQADVPMCVRAMKAGAVEFLTKPVRHQDLLSAVDLAVGRLQLEMS